MTGKTSWPKLLLHIFAARPAFTLATALGAVAAVAGLCTVVAVRAQMALSIGERAGVQDRSLSAEHGDLLSFHLLSTTGAVEPIPSAALGSAATPPSGGGRARSPLPTKADRKQWQRIERLLAAAGLNLKTMLPALPRSSSAEGGPYIALNDPRAKTLTRSRIEDLMRLTDDLPLGAPLTDYQLGSGFGARFDPVNHQAAFHPGLDMVAAYRSGVFSTGPGTVSFAGSLEGYGRVVEIDHGHGIITRYAHLHRILAATGQTVAAGTKLGELGSTGRSTGPHLHYEIRVTGVPVDPAKFIEIGESLILARGQQ